MAMKRVLVFAGKLGYQTRSFDAAARKLGVELGFVTDRCHQLDDPWGDRAIAVHFESPEAAAYTVLEKIRDGGARVDGILALGDRPAVAAAYVARGLGLIYNHPGAVEACRSKLRMREVFREAGLLVPWFRAVALHPAPEPALLGISYPCVLKPLSLSASTGVIRANNREEFVAAAARVRRVLQSAEILASREANLDQMIVEGYIPGREVAVEGLLTDGEFRVLAIFDKADALEGPFFEETIYVTPSRLTDVQQQEIEKCAVAAVRALGLSHGPVHAEFRINEEGVWPVEMAAGGWRREAAASGVMMIPVPASGVLEGVEGEAAARAVLGVTDLEITARLHDYIAAWPEGASYLGFLFAQGESADEVERGLRLAHGELRFVIRERLAVEHPVTGRVAG